jgi:hypothetical protein
MYISLDNQPMVYRLTKIFAKYKFQQIWNKSMHTKCMDMCMEIAVKLNIAFNFSHKIKN